MTKRYCVIAYRKKKDVFKECNPREQKMVKIKRQTQLLLEHEIGKFGWK